MFKTFGFGLDKFYPKKKGVRIRIQTKRQQLIYKQHLKPVIYISRFGFIRILASIVENLFLEA